MLIVKAGDVLDEVVDVLICSANVKLDLSGGVNGALLQRGGAGVQAELRAHLAGLNAHFVPPESVVPTGPGPLSVKTILHAVAIDGFYDSSVERVQRTLETAYAKAAELGARSLALPALATGYGPLELEDFARAFVLAWPRIPPSCEVRLVLFDERRASRVRAVLEELKLPHS